MDKVMAITLFTTHDKHNGANTMQVAGTVNGQGRPTCDVGSELDDSQK
jgi:hypothetical protein